MSSSIDATHFLTPADTHSVPDLVKKNHGRRFAKADHTHVPTKPRKDWHIKAFKHPAENVVAVAQGAIKKTKMEWMKLVVLGIMGGIYVGFGGALGVTAAGGLDPTFATNYPSIPKILNGLCFPVALTLILIAGAELFTSNVMYMTIGVLSGATKVLPSLRVLLTSYFTNYAGTVIAAAFCVHFDEILNAEPYMHYIEKYTQAKFVAPSFGLLLLRAIPANMLVNLAVLMGSAAEDIIGKLVAMYLPIFAFAVIGYEHIIANEFYVHLSMFNNTETHLAYGLWLWKCFISVTIGNVIGGCVIGTVYWYCYLDYTIPKKAQWIVKCNCLSKKQKAQLEDDEM